MTAKLVQLRGIHKSYPGVVALHDVDFTLAAGEVRALLGKNGAGKSTLIKILGGVEHPDSGTIAIAGQTTRLKSPADGIASGIATVHQELSIVPELSVGENIFLGRWPRRGASIDWRQIHDASRQALALLGLDIDPKLPASAISVAERQLVEIARALRQGARVLILDEPTSSLVAREVDILMTAIRKLAEAGVGVIYISHRMDEIRRIARSVSVMRDGRLLVTAPLGEINNTEIVALMLGEISAKAAAPRSATSTTAAPVLSVHNLAVLPRVEDVSFDIRAGEILGIAGVLGSGRTEILQTLAGQRRPQRGSMTIDGRPYRPAHLREAIAAGVFMTPEDRRGQGAVTMLGIDENLVMANWNAVSRLGVIDRDRLRKTVNRSIAELGIALFRSSDALANLSGGNQQKVVIGKALNARPRILLLDEPTRGVDVGAKEQIYWLMRTLADDGLAVVFVSGELEEFPEVCDRVLVLRDGRITAELSGGEISTSALLNRTSGQ